MTTFRMHTDDDGEHYAYSHGQTHGDPFRPSPRPRGSPPR